MDVYHAASAVSSDDHEAIVFTWFVFSIGVLSYCGTKIRYTRLT